jgi:hypothetical protein
VHSCFKAAQHGVASLLPHEEVEPTLPFCRLTRAPQGTLSVQYEIRQGGHSADVLVDRRLPKASGKFSHVLDTQLLDEEK